MQANPGKSQAIFFGKRGHGDCESFTIQNHNVKCEDSVKSLGVTIDYTFLISVKKQPNK